MVVQETSLSGFGLEDAESSRRIRRQSRRCRISVRCNFLSARSGREKVGRGSTTAASVRKGVGVTGARSEGFRRRERRTY